MSKVGVNLLYINPKLAGGSVTYALKLIKEISLQDKLNQYVIYLNKDCENLGFNIGDNFKVRILNFRYSSVYLRYFWEQVILPYYLFVDKIDLHFASISSFVSLILGVILPFDFPRDHYKSLY